MENAASLVLRGRIVNTLQGTPSEPVLRGDIFFIACGNFISVIGDCGKPVGRGSVVVGSF